MLTSVPGGPPMVCLLCASKGLHEVGSPPFSTAPQVSIGPPCLSSWALSAGSHPWPLGLTLCPLFTLPTPSWCSAKSAVTLSIHSVWRRPNGPCPNIMTPGAAAAASFATSVDAKAGDPRFGHGSRASGWRRGGEGCSCVSRFCHCCLSRTSQQHLLECERCRHAYHPACLGPSYPTRATRKRRHWVRDEAHAPCFGALIKAATTPRLTLGQGFHEEGKVRGPCESLSDKQHFLF